MWETPKTDFLVKNALKNARAQSCADPESYVGGGPFLTTLFFLVDEGRREMQLKSGPSSANQRNAIFVGGPMIARQ